MENNNVSNICRGYYAQLTDGVYKNIFKLVTFRRCKDESARKN